MRTFKITNRKMPKKFLGKRGKKRRKHALAEGVMKARLNRSGLWDASAAKSKLVVYRVGDLPPAQN